MENYGLDKQSIWSEATRGKKSDYRLSISVGAFPFVIIAVMIITLTIVVGRLERRIGRLRKELVVSETGRAGDESQPKDTDTSMIWRIGG